MKKVFLGLILFLFVGIFAIGLSGNKEVLKTVIDDSSLPALKVNGIKLHVETFGETSLPVLVVIHGGPGSDYRSLLPLKDLANQYHVVFYDQRGAGLSQRVNSDQLTLDSYREELFNIIQHFSKDKKVYLVGHSWGAMLATYFISKYPELVERVVLAEPGFLNEATFIETYKRTNGFMPRNPSLTMGWNVLKAFIRSKFINGPDGDSSDDYFVQGLVSSSPTESPIAGYFCGGTTENGSLDFWRFGAKSFQVLNTLGEAFKKTPDQFHFNLVDGVEDFKNPVLFLTGSCNVLIGPDIQAIHVKLFPNATLKVIDEAGHTMIGEKPKESVEIIREFFK